MDIALWIILGIVVLLVIYVIALYNKLVSLRGRVKNAWAQIEVQLKRRFDLIPNLVETVKGYAAHEKNTLAEVTDARTRFASATTPEDMMRASGELSQVLTRLMAVAEAYPELKADANFRQLQQELTNTEDKLGFARQFYNDTVMKFNVSIEHFPAVLIARMMGFKQEPYFEAGEEAQATPKVSF